MSIKNPLTPAGTEPATHCATAVRNRNEYQEYLLRVKADLRPSRADFLAVWETQTRGILWVCPGRYRNRFTLFLNKRKQLVLWHALKTCAGMLKIHCSCMCRLIELQCIGNVL